MLFRSDRACLERELREELGVEARVLDVVLTTTHRYADRVVTLHFFRCRVEGDPVSALGQEMRWVTREELVALPVPDADREIVRILAAGS